jgi:S1-C subfamily serine protease
VIGTALELRPDDADRAASRRAGDDEGRGVVAATFAECGAPASLAEGLDTRVMPVVTKDARRRMWLGVEYEPLKNAAVAEALDVTAPSRDGTRGLLVNVVHEGSPAAKAGVRVDDLLLSARRVSSEGAESAPVDLKDAAGAADWSDEAEFARPWAPRANALVRLLEAWGEGTRYRVEAWRGGAATTFDLVVEAAPRDVSNAVETRDVETGLAVKELTYEVRHALRLGKDAPGVLVSDVEEGSPAHQARIAKHEVLTEVDGTPVKDPHQLADLFAAARKQGRTDLRAVVLRLDRSRFVDLRIRPPGATPPSDR